MPGVNRVLYNLDQRGETTPEERATARRNIDAISADEVAILFDDHYKVKQSPINMTFAANAVLRRLWQNPNGEIGAECNYIYDATQSASGFMSPADKTKLDGIAYGAEVNVQSDWNVNDDTLDSFIRNRPDLSIFATRTELDGRLQGKQDKLTAGNNITIDANNVISATADPQVQADWAQNDSSAVDYIKNRPQNLVQDPDYVHTDNNFTDADKTKLAGIEAGAEVNVKPDWNAAAGSDAEILNKPQNLVQDADYHHTDNNFTTAEKNKLAGIEAGAEVNVQSDWDQNDSSADDYIKHRPDLSVYATKSEVATDLAGKQDTLTAGSNITITNNVISATAEPQQQADWAQNDSSQVDYIKNRPQNLVQDADYVHTDNNFTDADKTKLAGIEAGAEANVQADWAQNDSSQDDYIKNRPDLSVYATKAEVNTGLAGKQDTLTAGSNISIVNNVISATAAPQEQADWAQTDSSAVDYIKNKPANIVQDPSYVHTDNNFTTTEKDKLAGIEAGAEVNVQSDWNQTDTTADDFIRNKPSIPAIPPMKNLVAGQGITITPGYSDVTISTDAAIPTLEWQQDNQGSTPTYNADRLTIHQDLHTVTMHGTTSGSGTPNLGYLAPPMQSAPATDKVLKVPSGSTVPVWDDFPTGPNVDQTFDGTSANAQSGVAIQAELNKKQKTLTAGSGITITSGANSDTVAWDYTVGRNLHVNQNNAIQTYLPGGAFSAPQGQSNSFTLLADAKFAGSYRLACRHNTEDKYELGISYYGSGTSSTVSFIGTETVIGTDNSVTTHQAVFIDQTVQYTPTSRFGGTAATPFDPATHKAIIYDGIGLIGPTSDCKIVLWKAGDGYVKIAFTAVEVGKVGATN